jgi:hypothetical protein
MFVEFLFTYAMSLLDAYDRVIGAFSMFKKNTADCCRFGGWATVAFKTVPEEVLEVRMFVKTEFFEDAD